jgi:trigger factor
LKVNTEKTAPCEYVLNVEIEPERLAQPLRQAARRLSTRRPLSGFRPGKAPYNLVERVYGKELVYDEMLNAMGSELYQEALKEAQIEPYDRAGFEIAQLEPLILKITVPTQPVVTLGDYHTIRVEPAEAVLTEEEVDEVLSNMQQDRALWVPVERGVEMGDQAVIDAIGTSDDGRDLEQTDLTLEVTENLMPSEFREYLLGIKPGENKEFDIEYPEDFRDADLAGRHVHFNVSVKAVKEKELPALDDELARSMGEYETLDALREDIRAKLLERKEKETRDAAVDAALDALAEQANLEYPAIAVEHELDAIIQSVANRLSQQGFTLEGYLYTTGRSLEQYREELRPDAETRLRRSLVLTQFAQAEGIQVAKADIEREVDQVSAEFGEHADAVKTALSEGEAFRSITNSLFGRKVLDHLLAVATGQVEAGSKDEDASSEPQTEAETTPDADEQDT